jgi:hypothetical protein
LITLHPQYIKDADGNKTLVILTSKEFDTILEELEELEDVTLYDEAKKEDTDERILLSDHIKSRKEKNAQIYGCFVQKASKAIGQYF